MLTAGDVVNRIKSVMAVQGVQWSDATTRDRFRFTCAIEQSAAS